MACYTCSEEATCSYESIECVSCEACRELHLHARMAQLNSPAVSWPTHLAGVKAKLTILCVRCELQARTYPQSIVPGIHRSCCIPDTVISGASNIPDCLPANVTANACIHVHTFMQTFTNTYSHLRSFLPTDGPAARPAHLPTYLPHTYLRTYVNASKNARMHASMHTMQCIRTYMYACKYVCLCVCRCRCVYICMRIRMRRDAYACVVYGCIRLSVVCLPGCLSVCLHVTNVHVYVCVFAVVLA